MALTPALETPNEGLHQQVKRGETRDRGAGDPGDPRVSEASREKRPTGPQGDAARDLPHTEFEPGSLHGIMVSDRHASRREIHRDRTEGAAW